MPYYEKVVGDDGAETYVEVEPDKLEVPDTHPVNGKLKAAREESRKRRLRIQELTQELEALEEDDPDDNPAENVDPQREVPVTLDPAEFARQVRAQLQQEEAAERTKAAERKAAIDLILKDTGLSEDFRPTIEAIPDVAQGRAEAVRLAKLYTPFEDAAGGGNGEREMSSVYKGAEERMGFKTEAQ